MHKISSRGYSENKSHNDKIGKPAKTIGHFIIGEKLGEGTFSKVCLGTHITTNEKV
jgi:hypothetical protein